MGRGGISAPFPFSSVEFHGCDFSVLRFFDEFLSELFCGVCTVCVNNNAAAAKLSVGCRVGISDFVGLGFATGGCNRSNCFIFRHFMFPRPVGF